MKKSYNMRRINGKRKGRKDTFREFMIESAEFDGKWEIPIIPNNVYTLPKNLVAYDQRKNVEYCENTYIHFFIDDYKFDGPNGIWNGSSKNFEQKRGFSISSLNKFSGIIGPDFTMGFSFPLATQLDCCRRRRYFEYWLYSLGFQVIPFVRWTDERSYEFAFLGVSKGSVVAISTFGSMKESFLKDYFKKGLVEMINIIEPKVMVIYGCIPDDIRQLIPTCVKIINFESDLSIFRGRN